MTTLASLAALEATLKLDLIATIGSPVLTLIESTQTIAQGVANAQNPSAATIAIAIAQENAAWMTFQANALGALPNLAADAVVALSAFALGKLQTALPSNVVTSNPAPAAK